MPHSSTGTNRVREEIVILECLQFLVIYCHWILALVSAMNFVPYVEQFRDRAFMKILETINKDTKQILLTEGNSRHIWHLQLGHLNTRAINTLCSNNIIHVIGIKNNDTVCVSCMSSKSHKFSHKSRSTLYTQLPIIFAR